MVTIKETHHKSMFRLCCYQILWHHALGSLSISFPTASSSVLRSFIDPELVILLKIVNGGCPTISFPWD
jgi:hypothetical protein